MGHAGHLGEIVDRIAGGHGRLHRERRRGGHHQPAQSGDEHFFLSLVHFLSLGQFYLLARP